MGEGNFVSVPLVRTLTEREWKRRRDTREIERTLLFNTIRRHNAGSWG